MALPIPHDYPFDPTHGLGIAALRMLRPPEAPPGFDAMWQARHDGALAVDARPERRPSEASHPDWEVEDLRYTSTGGTPIGGWLMRPRNGRVRRGLVVGHGYGGRDAPDFDLPVKNTVVLFPCLRGLSRSPCPGVPADPAGHVLHGSESVERSILGGCVEDLWVAVSALLALHPNVEGRIGYSGISFGGGIGALALARDRRIARGHLTVPTFGNMPLWLTLPSAGSAGAVQARRRTHPAVEETFRFFDAAVAASRITIPMLTAVALFDPVVAPPCQFSVANALPPTNHHETVILDGGHVDYPRGADQHARLSRTVRRFFGAI